MTAVFRLFGVDYVQWKAVTRTLLRTDFRVPLTTRASAFGKLGDLLGMVVILGIFGLGAAAVVLVTPDVLLTGIVVLTYLSVMLVTTLLAQHGTTLLSSADHVILGSRPVSSRTFFAIRVTNVLFHALLLTSLMAYPVILAYAFARGLDVGRAMAAAIATYGWAITVALMLVASYSTLLRAVGAARFQRAVGYLQLIAGFLAYGGVFLTSRFLVGTPLANAAMPDTWWLVLIPPAWFASYLEIAAGALNSTTVVRALTSVLVFVGLCGALRGRLGVDYANRLAELPSVPAHRLLPTTRTPLFRRGEARAVAILVMAHFRHDLRVRMGILAIVPLVFFYLIVGTREKSFDLVALAVLLFPALVSQHFAAADAHQASWMYHSTPADLPKLVIALKNIAVVYFLLPFLLFVAAVFTWRLGDVESAIVQTLMLGLISHIALQGSVIISPRLPFALPPDKTRGSVSLIAWMFVVILGGQAAVLTLDRWVYVTPGRTIAVLSLLVALTWALNRAAVWRATSMHC